MRCYVLARTGSGASSFIAFSGGVVFSFTACPKAATSTGAGGLLLAWAVPEGPLEGPVRDETIRQRAATARNWCVHPSLRLRSRRFSSRHRCGSLRHLSLHPGVRHRCPRRPVAPGRDKHGHCVALLPAFRLLGLGGFRASCDGRFLLGRNRRLSPWYVLCLVRYFVVFRDKNKSVDVDGKPYSEQSGPGTSKPIPVSKVSSFASGEECQACSSEFRQS